jgi:hypothetical protein
MADPRRPVKEEQDPQENRYPSELEREERRLERLRLVVSQRWPSPAESPEPNEAA